MPSHGVSHGMCYGGLSERTHANRMHSHVVVRLEHVGMPITTLGQQMLPGPSQDTGTYSNRL